MEAMMKKYQQKFKKIKDEMDAWGELQSLLVSQYSKASSTIQTLQVINKSRNYGGLKCVEGIEGALLAKQMESLQTLVLSMNMTLENFHKVVLSIEKIVRDSRQLVKGGSGQLTNKLLNKHISVKPNITDCLNGLRLLEEMHQSEYHLKLSVVSALPELALKSSGVEDDLVALRQLLVDQPNIPREEVEGFD